MQQYPPRLVVGLGNPGTEYAGSRHNAGFMALDAVLASLPRPPGEPRHVADSLVWSCRFAGRTLLLQKPLTWMNHSGSAVARLCRKQKLLPPDILVVYDDADLPLGKLRLRRQGSDAGHKGIASIIEELGARNFNCLRPHVRPGPRPKKRVWEYESMKVREDGGSFPPPTHLHTHTRTHSSMTEFVLEPFSEVEKPLLGKVLAAAGSAVRLAVHRGMETAMNKYNRGQISLEEENEQN